MAVAGSCFQKVPFSWHRAHVHDVTHLDGIEISEQTSGLHRLDVDGRNDRHRSQHLRTDQIQSSDLIARESTGVDERTGQLTVERIGSVSTRSDTKTIRTRKYDRSENRRR